MKLQIKMLEGRRRGLERKRNELIEKQQDKETEKLKEENWGRQVNIKGTVDVNLSDPPIIVAYPIHNTVPFKPRTNKMNKTSFYSSCKVLV